MAEGDLSARSGILIGSLQPMGVMFRIGNMGTNIALARILTEGEIGIFAVASTILLTLLNLNDMGLVWGLVRSAGKLPHRAAFEADARPQTTGAGR